MSNGPRLELEVERREESAGTIVIVRADGEVDLSNSERLTGALAGVNDERPAAIFDLRQVTFMDSSGLKILLLAAGQLGDDLALVLEPGGRVEELLGVTEVSDRFQVFGELERALAAVTSDEMPQRGDE